MQVETSDSVERRCNVCLQTKNISYFYKDKTRPLGKSYTCKECRNKKVKKYISSLSPETISERGLSDNKSRRKRYYQKYKDTTIREYSYKTKYGIDLKQYNELFEKQKGLCFICGKKSSRKLVVDHDHKTNKIRGLLCHSCNLGLGSFGDSIFNLKNAILYLEKSRADESEVDEENDENNYDNDDIDF